MSINQIKIVVTRNKTVSFSAPFCKCKAFSTYKNYWKNNRITDKAYTIRIQIVCKISTLLRN